MFFDSVVVFGPSNQPLNAAIAEAINKTADIAGAYYPPFVLEEMAARTGALQSVQGLEFVGYGGGALSKETGDKLAKLTKVHDVLGSTEGLLPAHFMTEPEDWPCFHFHPAAGFVPEPLHHNLYETVVRRKPEPDAASQAAFKVFRELDEYETGDTVTQHPTKPDLWLHHGRVDDLIVLSTGEKFDPLPAEAMIAGSPLIRRCFVLGDGRPHSVLLVERDPDATQDMAAEDLKHKLWPLVERANANLATYARLARDRIVIAPADKSFVMSSKGETPRKATAAKFEVELNDQSVSIMPVPASSLQPADAAAKAVRRLLSNLCGIVDVGDEDDLFELGVDSMQAQQIAGALRGLSSTWPRDAGVFLARVYADPTVNGLVKGLGREDSPSLGGEAVSTESLVTKYVADFWERSCSARAPGC